MSETTTIEINGAKFEVDLRHAKRIDTLRVGDRVKVLVKQYTDYAVYPGTVIGFEAFKELPTVIIAYLKHDYSSADVKFLYFNAQTKETEIVKAIDDDFLELNKAETLRQMDRVIEQKLNEVDDLRAKRAYFLENFRAYFPTVPVVAGDE
jgi:hypothetical protein